MCPSRGHTCAHMRWHCLILRRSPFYDGKVYTNEIKWSIPNECPRIKSKWEKDLKHKNEAEKKCGWKLKRNFVYRANIRVYDEDTLPNRNLRHSHIALAKVHAWAHRSNIRIDSDKIFATLLSHHIIFTPKYSIFGV